jgi:hypothetical protein
MSLVLPVSSISREIASGKLKPLPLARGGKRTVQLHFIFNDGDRIGPAERSFIGELRYQSMNVTNVKRYLINNSL